MDSLRAVTVTLNPALDMTGGMQSLSIGSVNLIEHSHLNPGGKGINVAKVLAELGAKITVTGFLGEENQEPFVQLFKQRQIDDQFIRIAGASRINVKLVEASGEVTDLNFPGVSVSDAEIAALENRLFDLAQTHDLFVIAGSLPKGLSPNQLFIWVKALQEKGVKVLFDSSHQALTEGLKATPWLVKPNDEELAHWVGHSLSTEKELLEAGETLAKTGIQNVVISRGAEGVLWCKDGVWLASQPPKMKVVSTVGAGDTLVAGMCWAEMNQWSHAESLSFATAISALAVTQVNVGVDDIQQVQALQSEITIKEIQ